MVYTAHLMAFQMGFNWCGDKNKCLFEKGEKRELEEFIETNTSDYWDILNIGIAEKNNGRVKYSMLNETNNHRIDELGEFLNRPLFIMQSKII